ncbi:PREDICTED: uncharacterized protein LOC108361448 [Rhagoletis zephyria]|uniref:uncharacterized protein LOC108361448 n=1 Tax=Rhagoletis zephyria TaxID=28612 RepID=UPI0008112EB4|nr:PREDICTED: uncharacterized protein LOC108361448 [Rhagoletis zephyria]
MSKFCGVISKRLNSEALEPMRFSHLEMLIHWLASETESLESDFLTKSEAVQEQQLQVIQNENKLNGIHEIMQTLKQKVAATEQELQVNGASIKMLESNIKALEDYAKRPLTPAGITCGCPLVCQQHQQHNMLNLLQDTDHTINQMNTLMNEMHELEPNMEQMSNPYHTISSILDCHVSTLKQTEKNLDRLVDKLNAVDGMFQLAMRHLAASRQNR